MRYKFVLAPDSFKGSLTAVEAAKILSKAALEEFPGSEIILAPVADGGEGTVDALIAPLGGKLRTAVVSGPFGNRVDASYGMADASAIIEMAAASGLPLTRPDNPDALRASSAGTGELILDALNSGATRILIGIGGSATNDGGMGMLRALGAKFFDAFGNELQGCGADLISVKTVDLSGLDHRLSNTDIEIISDVTNPLTGKNGATYTYGPQKGATPEALDTLESGMINYAGIMEDYLGRDISSFPGAGAAGGLGAALKGVLGGRLVSGIDAVLDLINFDEMLRGCNLVVTGEGRLDSQSVKYGKAPTGIARRCQKFNIPVVAVVGGMGPGAEEYLEIGNCSIMSLTPAPMSLKEAIDEAPQLMEGAARRLFRTLKLGMLMCSGTD